jgi:Fe-S-cluster containining protein
MLAAPAPAIASSICQSCGACCAYSRDWPRFTTESDAEIGRIADTYIRDDSVGLSCDGDRCSALMGAVGTSTSCAIYAVRPDVCRACEPGDEACTMARLKFGLEATPAGY